MRSIYFILLLLWFVLAYFLINKNVSDDHFVELKKEIPITETQNCESKLVFKDQDFLMVTKENFKFLKSNFNHNNLNENFQDSLLKVAHYLDANPQRKMKIKGYYLKDEENTTDYENLGLARANSVKTYFLTLGVNSSQLLTSSKITVPECFNNENILNKGIVVAFGQ